MKTWVDAIREIMVAVVVLLVMGSFWILYLKYAAPDVHDTPAVLPDYKYTTTTDYEGCSVELITFPAPVVEAQIIRQNDTIVRVIFSTGREEISVP